MPEEINNEVIRVPLRYCYDTYDSEPDVEYVAVVNAINDMRDTYDRGETLYIEFMTGDRKGSIAKFIPSIVGDNSLFRHPEKERARRRVALYADYRNRGTLRTLWSYNVNFYGVCKWTGKSHSPKATLYDGSLVWLKGYKGPTVWKKFDAKAAAEKILTDHGQTDIDGRLINVGDRVLFVNLQYYNGAKLERGTIKEFKVSVDSRKHTVYTIVETIDGSSSMKTEHPEKLILKVENANAKFTY